jgi:hypothetical protein
LKANTITESQDYAELLKSLDSQNYVKALIMYAALFNKFPQAFDLHNSQGCISNLPSHLQNMASLSRKALYDEASPMLSCSNRLQQALETMVGLRPKQFSHPLQQPNFFYIPGLLAKPFYTIADIPGIDKCVDALRDICTWFSSFEDELPDSYLDNMGFIPDQIAWKRLKNKKWASQHLIRGGKILTMDSLKASLLAFLECETVANCPPHAPELFLSRLEPNTVIPPHYGISNLKLTVHLPINVNTDSVLTAGDVSQSWDGKRDIIIFDDSFLHSAKNDGKSSRTVLIFDVWHPDLSKDERDAVSEFMQLFEHWNKNFGKLAVLDKKGP